MYVDIVPEYHQWFSRKWFIFQVGLHMYRASRTLFQGQHLAILRIKSKSKEKRHRSHKMWFKITWRDVLVPIHLSDRTESTRTERCPRTHSSLLWWLFHLAYWSRMKRSLYRLLPSQDSAKIFVRIWVSGTPCASQKDVTITKEGRNTHISLVELRMYNHLEKFAIAQFTPHATETSHYF